MANEKGYGSDPISCDMCKKFDSCEFTKTALGIYNKICPKIAKRLSLTLSQICIKYNPKDEWK